MTTIQGNLGAIAKELDAAQKRLDKIRAGKGHAKNIGDATSAAEAIDREWQNQAPYVFEQLQALDEHRINHLRDVLTQLQTHEVDQVERNRISAESCLNALLSVDTKEEISAFVARTSAGTPSIQPTQRSRMASGATLSTPLPPRTQDDRASEVSATSEGPLGSASAGAPGTSYPLPTLSFTGCTKRKQFPQLQNASLGVSGSGDLVLSWVDGKTIRNPLNEELRLKSDQDLHSPYEEGPVLKICKQFRRLTRKQCQCLHLRRKGKHRARNPTKHKPARSLHPHQNNVE